MFFQLTLEAEKKVVQSRELLDTIVKENRGKLAFDNWLTVESLL